MDKVDIKKLEQIEELIKDLDIESLDESIIIDNKIPFFDSDKSYRVRMPSQKEMSELHQYLNKFKIGLYSSGEKIYRLKELKKLLKEKQDVNIDKYDEDLEALRKEIEGVSIDVALIHPDKLEQIQPLKEKIEELKQKHTRIFLEKEEWLTPALERQIDSVYMKYATYLCLEIDDKGTWKKVYDCYEDFDNEENRVTAKYLKFMNYLISRRG